MKKSIRIIIISFSLPFTVQGFTFSQGTDSTTAVKDFKCFVNLTTNGISNIPAFTLGKPASIIEFSVGRRLTFDPQFRFSLEGKPWAFVFWLRYKLLNTGKFRLNVGAHPALLFAGRTVSTGQSSSEIIEGRRYLAAAVSPGYAITKNVMVGMYYLNSHGMEKDVIRQVHFLTLRTVLSDLKLSDQFFLHITPQLYYLRLDEQDGFYFSSECTLTRENFPLSVSSVINKRIRSNITMGSEFVWNVTLTYTFDRQYVRFLNKGPEGIPSL